MRTIYIKEILDTDKEYPEKLKTIYKHPTKLYAVRKCRIIAKFKYCNCWQ